MLPVLHRIDGCPNTMAREPVHTGSFGRCAIAENGHRFDGGGGSGRQRQRRGVVRRAVAVPARGRLIRVNTPREHLPTRPHGHGDRIGEPRRGQLLPCIGRGVIAPRAACLPADAVDGLSEHEHLAAVPDRGAELPDRRRLRVVPLPSRQLGCARRADTRHRRPDLRRLRRDTRMRRAGARATAVTRDDQRHRDRGSGGDCGDGDPAGAPARTVRRHVDEGRAAVERGGCAREHGVEAGDVALGRETLQQVRK